MADNYSENVARPAQSLLPGITAKYIVGIRCTQLTFDTKQKINKKLPVIILIRIPNIRYLCKECE